MQKAVSLAGVISLIFLLIILAIFGAYLAITRYYGSTCIQSAQSEVYLTVRNDSSTARVKGAAVTGNVKWFCGSNAPPGYFIASQNIGSYDTPANGTLLIGSIIGNYSLTVYYSSHTYKVSFSPGAEQNVNVTLAVPSGQTTVVGCAFGSNNLCFNEANPNSTAKIQTTS